MTTFTLIKPGLSYCVMNTLLIYIFINYVINVFKFGYEEINSYKILIA